MHNRPKLVVVGNGMAGVACLEQLLRLVPERYDVTVFGDENYPNHNRILLSSVLAGEASWDHITLNPEPWYVLAARLAGQSSAPYSMAGLSAW
jgi:nitrite reductase (NADH) large subunit